MYELLVLLFVIFFLWNYILPLCLYSALAPIGTDRILSLAAALLYFTLIFYCEIKQQDSFVSKEDSCMSVLSNV